MRGAPLSRFQVALIMALATAAAALVWRNFALLGLTCGLFAMVVGFGVVFPQWQFFGPFLCVGRTNARQIALTFDDGPDPRSTPLLLDLLGQSNVKAAFFCIG